MQPKVQARIIPMRYDPPPGFIAVRDEDNRLLFFYNPETTELLIKPRGTIKRIVLSMYHRKAAS